jgi:predicted nuclease with TOPRIM domain
MGINWWEGDPYLSSKAQGLIEENRELRGRLANLESQINLLTSDIAKTSVEKPELTVENNLNGDDNTQELSEEITPISVDQEELEQYTIVSDQIPGNLQENTDYIGDFNQQDFVLEETETTQPDTQAVVELDDEIG